MTRAEDRKYHFTYQVVCTNTGRIFYGLYSCDKISTNFNGTGQQLWHSKKEYGEQNHIFKILNSFDTRKLAREEYNKLKTSELSSFINAEDHLYHYVYLTTRFDGKYYIGAHSTSNLNDKYMGSGTYIGNSLRKHGKDKHTFEILEMCSSREHAFQREDEIITPEILADPLCMNLGKGGTSGNRTVYGFTEEVKKKISDFHKGRVLSEDHKKKLSIAKSGVKFSEEHKEKLSLSKVGKLASKAQLDNIQKVSLINSGKCTTDGGITVYNSKTELCNALGYGKTGGRSPNFIYLDTGTKYMASEEVRQKIKNAFIGKPRCEKSKRALDRKCTVDGVLVFNSVAELINTLGYGKNGRRSKNFRYVN